MVFLDVVIIFYASMMFDALTFRDSRPRKRLEFMLMVVIPMLWMLGLTVLVVVNP